MKIVVDASIAVKWGIAEDLHDEACKIIKYSNQLVAPDLLYPEIANICWKKVTKNEIGFDQAKLIMALARQIIPVLIPTNPLAERAFEIAAELRHPAYDGFYLASAEAENAILVTADKRLLKKVENTKFARLVCSLDADDMEFQLDGRVPQISRSNIAELLGIITRAQQTRSTVEGAFNPSSLRLREVTKQEGKMLADSTAMRQALDFLRLLSLSERTDLVALLWAARDALSRNPETDEKWHERRARARSIADNVEYLLGYALIPGCLAKANELIESTGKKEA